MRWERNSLSHRYIIKSAFFNSEGYEIEGGFGITLDYGKNLFFWASNNKQ